jgi:hypothetical protein
MNTVNLKEIVLELKEFYKLICDEFNDGKNLEYKWTRADGYWKMTKGFFNGGRSVSLHAVAEALIYDKQVREMKKKKKKPRSKKIINKYKGD